MSPYQLVLTQPPPHLALSKVPTVDHDSLSPNQVRRRFLNRLKALVATATKNLATSQARYKRNFDAHIKPKRFTLKPGALVYIRREQARKGEPDNKLKQKALGPYEVTLNIPENHVVMVKRDGKDIPVSYDRIVVVPLGKPRENITNPTQSPTRLERDLDIDGQ